MPDQLPDHIMTPDRAAWARSIGLAQSIPKLIPEAVARPVVTPHAGSGSALADAVDRPAHPLAALDGVAGLQLVGETISGRQWIVMQMPGGKVRASGTEALMRDIARELAKAESGSFAVFQPRGITRPETTVTEELL